MTGPPAAARNGGAEVALVEGTVDANGVRLWYQDTGRADSPAVVLISGATAQAIAWPANLRSGLLNAGYRVVLFDNRDVGRSEWVDYQASPYTLDDMAEDTVALLAALRIQRAHVVGVSLGAMIAQIMAILHPDCVLTLTSWMSSPAPFDPDLPPMSTEIAALVVAPSALERAEWIEQRMHLYRAMAGTRFAFDTDYFRELAATGFDRGPNPRCAHTMAAASSSPRTDALGRLRVPTLVIHGDADRLLPYEHGLATARAIPGAEMITLTGVGHELHPAVVAEVLPRLIAHLRRVGEGPA